MIDYPARSVLDAGQGQPGQGALKAVKHGLVPAGKELDGHAPELCSRGDLAARPPRLVDPALVHEKELQGVPDRVDRHQPQQKANHKAPGQVRQHVRPEKDLCHL